MSIILDIPLELERRLGRLADSQGQSLDAYLTGIIKSLVPPQSDNPVPRRVLLLAHREAKPDQRLVQLLKQHLEAHGYTTWADSHCAMSPGWVQEREMRFKEADMVIFFLSSRSVSSEMLQYDAAGVYKANMIHGKPLMFGVRVNYPEFLPVELQRMADRMAVFHWRNSEEDELLVSEVMKALATEEREY